MKILMLGVYDINGYSRGRILYKGLKEKKVDIGIFLPKKNKYLMLVKRILKKDFDVLLVTGKFVLLFSWLLKPIHKKKIIFDVFISDYNTLVEDRKIVRKNSIKAKLLWLADKYSCIIADKIIHDTDEHIDYFMKNFDIDKEKFFEIPIGADEEIFYPRKLSKKDNKFRVEFHGTFIPLQGIEYIIKAAKLLEKDKNIVFDIIGGGQTLGQIQKLTKKLDVKNVIFHGLKPINEIPNYIANSDVCLGIFGDTEKAKIVIPNKAYEIIAMKKPLITGNTPAIRSKFTHLKDCYLTKIADERGLANAVRFLKENAKLKHKISEGGYENFKNKFSSVLIGKKLVEINN